EHTLEKSHEANISALAWNQDGTLLSSAGRDNLLVLWKDRRILSTFKDHQKVIYGLSWNPKSNILAACSGDKTGSIWNEDEKQAELIGHKRAVTVVGWNPSGSLVATGSADKTVRVWTPQGEEKQVLELEGALASLKWNPAQDDFLATGSYDKTVELWRDGESVNLLKGHRDRVFGLDWSKDGKFLASSSGFKDGEIIIWDDSGEKVTSFDDHTSSVYQVSWNTTNKLLASASFDGTARVWNMEGEQAVLRHPGPVFAAKWYNKGNLLATAGSGIVAIWDISKFY
ncbi:MAG: WD40 repeat domain-containing protein, partial [Candidatus Thorarchaeota archaeon]